MQCDKNLLRVLVFSFKETENQQIDNNSLRVRGHQNSKISTPTKVYIRQESLQLTKVYIRHIGMIQQILNLVNIFL